VCLAKQPRSSGFFERIDFGFCYPDESPPRKRQSCNSPGSLQSTSTNANGIQLQSFKKPYPTPKKLKNRIAKQDSELKFANRYIGKISYDLHPKAKTSTYALFTKKKKS